MKPEEILTGLEELLRGLAIEVRYERGEFKGGLYRYNDKKQVVINKDLDITKKIDIIANEVKKNVDLDNLYLVPALREVIDNAGSVE